MRGNYRNPAGMAPPTEMETAYAASPDVGSRHDVKYPEQVEICRRMSLVWVAHLSHAEFKLVAWIVGNTILRGNRSGRYSIPQICNGIPDRRNGGMQAEGTGLSPRSVTSITASLRERGLIHTEITARGTVFSIVPSWNPVTGKAEESNVVSLNLPRTARYLGPKVVHHVQETGTHNEWDETPATIAGPPLQPLRPF